MPRRLHVNPFVPKALKFPKAEGRGPGALRAASSSSAAAAAARTVAQPGDAGGQRPGLGSPLLTSRRRRRAGERPNPRLERSPPAPTPATAAAPHPRRGPHPSRRGPGHSPAARQHRGPGSGHRVRPLCAVRSRPRPHPVPSRLASAVPLRVAAGPPPFLSSAAASSSSRAPPRCAPPTGPSWPLREGLLHGVAHAGLCGGAHAAL